MVRRAFAARVYARLQRIETTRNRALQLKDKKSDSRRANLARRIQLIEPSQREVQAEQWYQVGVRSESYGKTNVAVDYYASAIRLSPQGIAAEKAGFALSRIDPGNDVLAAQSPQESAPEKVGLALSRIDPGYNILAVLTRSKSQDYGGDSTSPSCQPCDSPGQQCSLATDDDDQSKTVERMKREKAASSKLKLAKKLMENRKKHGARKWLAGIVAGYPGTEAAEEAERLLAGL